MSNPQRRRRGTLRRTGTAIHVWHTWAPLDCARVAACAFPTARACVTTAGRVPPAPKVRASHPHIRMLTRRLFQQAGGRCLHGGGGGDDLDVSHTYIICTFAGRALQRPLKGWGARGCTRGSQPPATRHVAMGSASPSAACRGAFARTAGAATRASAPCARVAACTASATGQTTVAARTPCGTVRSAAYAATTAATSPSR